MSTTWSGNTKITNLQGTGFVGETVDVTPYLAAGDYHLLLLAADGGAVNNYIRFAGFDGADDGFDPYKWRTNDGGWNTIAGSKTMRAYLVDADGQTALDIADAGESYADTGFFGVLTGPDVRDAAQPFTVATPIELRRVAVYADAVNGAGATVVTIGILTGTTPAEGTYKAVIGSQSLTVADTYNVSDELYAPNGQEGIFLIHDAGQTSLDAGANQSWDYSEFSQTSALTATYQYASYATDQGWSTAAEVDANASWNGSWLTLAQLQLVSNDDNRYLYLKCKIVKNSGSYYTSLTGTVYQVDVTPPAAPSSVKSAVLDSNNYALNWTEPADADYSHCELKRIIDGTTTYLNSVAGVATWQEAAGTLFQFIDGDASAGWQQSNYLDEGVSGTAIQHYVRSVDTNSNASGWTAFGAAAIALPGAPSADSATAGDTQVTVAFTAADESDVIYGRYRIDRPGEDWEDASESFKRTGSGNIAFTGLTNTQGYEFAGYAQADSGVISEWSNPVYAIPMASSSPVHDQIADAVAALLTSEGFTDYDSTAFTVSTAFPPRWTDKTAPTIFVLPDYADPQPRPTQTLETAYAVTVAICEHSENDGQLANRNTLLARIQQVLIQNRRPIANVWLDSDPFGESRVFEIDNLERFEFLTLLTVKYRGRAAR